MNFQDFIILLLSAVCGMAVGFITAWAIWKAKMTGMLSSDMITRDYVSKEIFDSVNRELRSCREELRHKDSLLLTAIGESESKLSKAYVAQHFVSRESYFQVISQLQVKDEVIEDSRKQITTLSEMNAALKTTNEELKTRFEEFKAELADLQEHSRMEFKNIANDIIKEKGKDLTALNTQSFDAVVKPFHENLKSFQKSVEETRKEDIADFTSLKKEIENLQKLNYQLSDEAQKLSNALRSDSKVQGSWGEDRLQLILESEGMAKYLDFTSQATYRDEELERNRRPDYIINLPGGKHIIIDSKVSLNAYVDYFNCDDHGTKNNCLKQLVKNLTDHIDDLSGKDYPSLTGLQSPDFVCMFVGLEPALTMAINEYPQLMRKAIDKNIIIVTPTTLIATLKMVDLIWKKESRVRNIEEIFKQCGMLYDKFVSFIEEFDNIGRDLQTAIASHKQGMNRLTSGANKGDTIIGRFERIRELEAKAKKRIPHHFVASIEVLSESTSTEPAEANLPVLNGSSKA
jgi:DNA recombination protein RmuC